MKVLRDEKGFTVIELLVTVAIAGVITSAIYFFLLTNIRIFGAGTSVTDAQYKAQYALEEITDALLPAEHIKHVLDDFGVVMLNSTTYADYVKVSSFQVEYPTAIGRSTVVITHDSNQELKIGSHTLSTEVERLRLKPVGGEQSFGGCSSVEVELVIKNEDTSITVNKQIKLRNR